MKILLQFPQGLKQFALKEAKQYESQGHTVFLSASSCWGACDLATDEAKKIGANKLIHYGHCKYHDTKEIEVEYKLFPIDIDLEVLKSSLQKIKDFKTVAIATTVSHIHQIEQMKKILSDAGHTVLTSSGNIAIMEAQVLGCDSSALTKLTQTADLLIYIGGGEFHPLGVSLNDKPVLAINPYANQSYFINEKIAQKEKRLRGALIACSSAKSFGILVSTKSGQFRLNLAETAKEKLRALNRQAYILVGSEFDFESIKDFNSFDAYITTACPRLEDDSERLSKPIINISRLPQLIELIKEIESK